MNHFQRLTIGFFMVTGATAGSWAQGSITLPISEQNGSGLNGTVNLEPDGDKTRVTMRLSGGSAVASHPAHVHDGTCDKIDPKPLYPLPNVIDGVSATTLPVKLDAILDGKHAINVHKSAADAKTYVACGTLARPAN